MPRKRLVGEENAMCSQLIAEGDDSLKRLKRLRELVMGSEDDVAAAQERLQSAIEAEHAAMLVGDATDETAAVDASRRALESAEHILSVRKSAAQELSRGLLNKVREDLQKVYNNLIMEKLAREKPLFEAILAALNEFPVVANEINQRGINASAAARRAVFGDDDAESEQAYAAIKGQPFLQTVILPNMYGAVSVIFEALYGKPDHTEGSAEGGNNSFSES